MKLQELHQNPNLSHWQIAKLHAVGFQPSEIALFTPEQARITLSRLKIKKHGGKRAASQALHYFDHHKL